MYRRFSLSSYGETIQILLLLVGWYTTSSFSNAVTKILLNSEQDPTFITVCHFFFVSCFSRCYLFFKNPSLPFLSIPQPSRRSGSAFESPLQLPLPLSLIGLMGHWLSALSLSYVPVSFTHTVKATSPIFSVILSRWILNEHTSTEAVASLLPIVFGVALSSSTDAEVNLPGFVFAILSTVIFVVQNVYSKKIGSDLDELELLFYSSFTCLCCLSPLWLLWTFGSFFSLSPADAAAALDDSPFLPWFFHLMLLYLCGGVSYFIQNLTAVMILKRMSPVSYSVGNTLKRVVVIISSILYFGNPISARNAIGMCLALSGVAFYNNARLRQNASLQKDLSLPISISNANIVI